MQAKLKVKVALVVSNSRAGRPALMGMLVEMSSSRLPRSFVADRSIRSWHVPMMPMKQWQSQQHRSWP